MYLYIFIFYIYVIIHLYVYTFYIYIIIIYICMFIYIIIIIFLFIQMGLYISDLIRYHGYAFVWKRSQKLLFSYIRDSKEAKFQYSGYRPFYVVPRRRVIPQPVSGVLARPCKCRPRKQEASFSREQRLDGSESQKRLELGKTDFF